MSSVLRSRLGPSNQYRDQDATLNICLQMMGEMQEVNLLLNAVGRGAPAANDRMQSVSYEPDLNRRDAAITTASLISMYVPKPSWIISIMNRNEGVRRRVLVADALMPSTMILLHKTQSSKKSTCNRKNSLAHFVT